MVKLWSICHCFAYCASAERHPDRVARLGRAGRAGDVTGGALEAGVPTVVREEDVVDVGREVVAVVAEVDALGHPVDYAAGQQPVLLLVLVVDEGDDQFLAAVVGVLADQRALLGGARDRGLDEWLEIGPGQRGGEVAVALADVRVVVLERDAALEVAEQAGEAGRGDLPLGAVEAADVTGVLRPVQTDVRAGIGVSVDLSDAEGGLEGGKGRHLGGPGGEGVVVGQDDTLELRAGLPVHGVAQEGGIDHGPVGVVQIDDLVGGALARQFGGDGGGGGATVADHEHGEVDPGGRRGVGEGRLETMRPAGLPPRKRQLFGSLDPCGSSPLGRGGPLLGAPALTLFEGSRLPGVILVEVQGC